MLRELETGKLELGMYVSALDRPWLGTPFPVQGFYIRSASDVARLADFCQTVFVDPRRYDPRAGGIELDGPGGSPDSMEPSVRPARARASSAKRTEDLPPPRVRYADDTSVEDELPAARDALKASTESLQAFFDEIYAKRHVQIGDVRSAVDPLVESVLRNKDALAALTRVRLTDRHTHEHCLAMAVWAGLMGRQLGLPSDEVKRLALGCALLDVGMVHLPAELLHSQDRLSKAERLILQSHVAHSLDMLKSMGSTDADVESVVRWHHERRDGSGYPDGLKGAQIPVHARIAGILDSYDAMISPRYTAQARSSFEALNELQHSCPERFQPELVDQYAQAVGLFPSGSLVELSTGEVAVVFSQNTGRRLRPRVMVILDADKRRQSSLPVIDLNAQGERSVRIARELPPGAHGIDAKEYFI